MDLAPGTRLGPYEIVSAVGAGGMGEVYRARDTRLDRIVAIKVLSRQFSSDAERLVRFEREAKTLASLNHPNIAQIFGTERDGDVHALAMEFVDGEELSRTLVHGRLPLEDALSIARQILDALEAAHQHSIIHRDLKPANIKVRGDGTVKVLDFGLAKTLDASRVVAVDSAANTGAVTSHPTLTSPAMTQVGVILGTAAYMSPEQAKGKTVDRGTDLWSFGAVLYEMLVGRAAFEGETVTDVLAAIVTREPDWTALPRDTPPAVRRLLRRCAERDHRRRLADAREARFQLDEARDESAPPAAAVQGGLRARLPWAVAALLAIAVGVLATRSGPAPASETSRFNVALPSNAQLSFASRPAVSVSADGRTIVFVGSVDGVDRLFVRRIDSFEAVEIAGTTNGSSPVISPDGRSVAFVAGTRLAKVSIGGGSVTALADIVEPRGISWDDDQSILYVPGPVGAIWRVPAAGGQASQITKPSSSAERTHRWPQQLPGGAVIFTIDSDATPDSYDDASIVAQMPDGSRHTVVSNTAMARYVPPEHLLFARNGTLFAVRFDPERAVTIGTPVEILHEVAGDLTTGAHHFAAAPSGTLVYMSGGNAPGSTVPVWADRAGNEKQLPLPAGAYNELRISPDGQQMAATVIAGGGSDVWVHHFQRGTFTKVTFGGQNVSPMWSRDGRTLYYTLIDAAAGRSTIMQRAADGSRQAEPLTTLRGRAFLNDVLADGRTLLISVFGAQYRDASGIRQAGVVRLPIEKNASPVPLLDEADEFAVRLSPDGRWVAFVARTPTRQVFVRPLSGSSRFQISTGGGEEPKWSSDGRYLYFRNDNVLMAATIDPRAPVFESSLPVPVLKGIFNLRNESGLSYDVDIKGERFLMVRPVAGAADALSLRVVTNWTRELR